MRRITLGSRRSVQRIGAQIFSFPRLRSVSMARVRYGGVEREDALLRWGKSNYVQNHYLTVLSCLSTLAPSELSDGTGFIFVMMTTW